MIRHPSEAFVKFLMTCNMVQAAKNDWVSMMLVSYGFPRPDNDYLVWLRAELMSRMPSNFQPTNRYHRESVKFMRTEGIYGLHNPDKASKQARMILVNLRARPYIESLLLGRIEPKDIAKKVNAKLGEFFTTESIESYAHYYWNTTILTVEEWSQLLKDYEVQRQHTMAILQVGPAMALHKMGFQQAIDSKTILRDMMEALYFDMKEWKVKGHGSDRTKALTALARSATMVDVQLSTADSNLKDALKSFEQFRMNHAKGGVKAMDQVAPVGNFTNSGVKLLEAKQPEEEGEL